MDIGQGLGLMVLGIGVTVVLMYVIIKFMDQQDKENDG